MYKKLSILIFSMLFLFSNVNSVLFYNTVDNTPLINGRFEKINVETSSYLNLIFTNLTYEVQEGANYNTGTSQLYIIYNFNNVPIDMTFQTFFKIGNETKAVFKDFSLDGQKSISFWIEPTEDLEYLASYVVCIGDTANNFTSGQKTTCGSGYNVKEINMVKGKGNINDVTETFVSAMKDLIDIQIGFWKLIYYLFIFGVILGGITLLIGFGFTIYDWAEKLSDKKKEIWHGGKK